MPNHPRGKTEERSYQRSQLQQTMKTYSMHNVRLAKEMNTLTPLGSVPTEILTEIIRIYAREWKAKFSNVETFGPYPPTTLRFRPGRVYREYGWISITHVCHALRAAAHSDPTLWTDIALISNDITSHFLRCVGPAQPLSVKVLRHTPIHSLRAMRDYASRIHTLDLRINYLQFARFARCFGASTFAHLQSLRLMNTTSAHVTRNIPGLDFFIKASLPRLKHLTLGGLLQGPLTTMLSRQQQLTSLNIRMAPSGYLSITQTLAALRFIPGLETVELEGEGFGESHDDSLNSPMDLPPLCLDRLHTFRVHSYPAFATGLFERLALPSLRVLELHSSTSSRAEMRSLLLRVGLMCGPLQSLSLQSLVVDPNGEESIHKIQIQGVSKSIDAQRTQIPHHFDVSFYLDEDRLYPRLLAEILEVLPLSQVQNLSLGPVSYDMYDDVDCTRNNTRRKTRCADYAAWATLIPNMPCVKEICVRGTIAYLIPHFLTGVPPSEHRPTSLKATKQQDPFLPASFMSDICTIHIQDSEFGPCHGIGLQSLVDALQLRTKHKSQVEKLTISNTVNLGVIEADILRKCVAKLEWDGHSRWVRAYRPYFGEGDLSYLNGCYLIPRDDDIDEECLTDSDCYTSSFYESDGDDYDTDSDDDEEF